MHAGLALISLLLTAGSFYMYTKSSPPSTMYLIATVVCLILTLLFGALFLSGRVNKTEDIHITE